MDINRYTPKLKLSTDKLLSLDNLTPEDIFEILHLARQIKQRDRMKERVYPLKDKVVAIILDSSNSRLRIPFELTVTQLGGHTLYLSPKDRDFMMGMTYRDVSAMLAQYGVHCLVTKAETAELRNELSRYSPLPVVNCMESSDNPSEVLAALFTVWEKKGKLENLKLTVVGNGKNLNPAAVNAYAKAGFSVSLLCPEGMEPDEDTVARASQYDDLDVEYDMRTALKNADVVTTRIFGDHPVGEEEKKLFYPLRADEHLMMFANPDAIYVHPLPIDRTLEASDEFLETPQAVISEQAGNLIYIQKTILSLLIK